MKLKLEYRFRPEDTWPSYLSGPVHIREGRIYYPYQDRGAICCIRIAPDGTVTELSYPLPKGRRPALTADWLIQAVQGHVVLSCGKQMPPDRWDLFLDLDDGMRRLEGPLQRCRPWLDETEPVCLSDCILRCKNSQVYQCFDLQGKLLWEEKHKGYRYTPFEERRDCIIFGTAGHGGGLYCYRKTDGKCLCSLDTKGTPHYVWCDEAIVTRGRDGELLLVDPFRGTILQSLSMGARFNDCSRFCCDGRLLCAVGFEKRGNVPCIYVFDLEQTPSQGENSVV